MHFLPLTENLSVSTSFLNFTYFFKFFCLYFHIDTLNGWSIFLFILFLFYLAAFVFGFTVYRYFVLFILVTFLSFSFCYLYFPITSSFRIGFLNFNSILTPEDFTSIIMDILSKEFNYTNPAHCQAVYLYGEFDSLIPYFQKNNIYDYATIKQVVLFHMKLK